MLMLLGAATECLFKALALNRGHVLAKAGKYQKIGGLKKEHDLVALASPLSFPVSPEEENLLHRLSLYIPGGRYPIQLAWNTNLIAAPIPGMGKTPATYWSFPSDDEKFRALLERLAKESE